MSFYWWKEEISLPITTNLSPILSYKAMGYWGIIKLLIQQKHSWDVYFDPSFKQRLHNWLDVQFLEVGIGLSTAHKHHWSPRYINHWKCSSHLTKETCQYIFTKIETVSRNFTSLLNHNTLSSIVSNLVSKIPSINLGVGDVERSANFCNEIDFQ